MKKIFTIIMILLLGLTTFSIAQAEESEEPGVEKFNLRVRVEFEESPYETYGQKPEAISINVGHIDENTSKHIQNEYLLKQENNFEIMIMNQPISKLDIQNNLLDVFYTVSLGNYIYVDDLKYYTARFNFFNESSTSLLESDGEFVIKFNLRRTDVPLTLIEGTEDHVYESECDMLDTPLGNSYAAIQASNNSLDDKKENGKDMSGARFELWSKDGKKIQEIETDASGKLVFEDVIFGEYIVKQVTAPEGLIISDKVFKLDLSRDIYDDICRREIKWYSESETTIDEPKDELIGDKPIDKPVKDVPNDEVIVESPELKEMNNKTVVDIPDAKTQTIPNTGISSIYTQYILIIIVSLFAIKHFYYIKNKNQ